MMIWRWQLYCNISFSKKHADCKISDADEVFSKHKFIKIFKMTSVVVRESVLEVDGKFQ